MHFRYETIDCFTLSIILWLKCLFRFEFGIYLTKLENCVSFYVNLINLVVSVSKTQLRISILQKKPNLTVLFLHRFLRESVVQFGSFQNKHTHNGLYLTQCYTDALQW